MSRITVADALARTEKPLSRMVLEYSNIFKRVVNAAKAGGGEIDWAPLAELVAVNEFVRVGVAKEVMNWPEYTVFLSAFAMSTEWTGYFRRITEAPNLVFLELEEHCTQGDRIDIANTLTVYEFNDAGKLRYLDIYMQHEMLRG